MTETAGNAHFVSGYKDAACLLLHSDRRADAILLESMIGDQQESDLIPKLVKGLLAHRKEGRWHNTNENAFVLLALDRYFNTYEKVTPDFVARIWLGDRFAGQHAFKGRTTERTTEIPMQCSRSEAKGGERTSCRQGRAGAPLLPHRHAVRAHRPRAPPPDRGFIVARVYEGVDKPDDVKRDADGTWRVKAGARVRVRLSMVAPARRYHVALVDPLPAGLEALNPALAVTGTVPGDVTRGTPRPRPRRPASQAAGGSGRGPGTSTRTCATSAPRRSPRCCGTASTPTVRRAGDDAGTFVVPPPKAEEMYTPETFGRGATDRVVVE